MTCKGVMTGKILVEAVFRGAVERARLSEHSAVGNSNYS